MMQTFACPSCHAALEYEPGSRATTVKCAYCGTTVIVPENLRGSDEDPRFAAAAQAEIWAELDALLRNGRKIEAIKRFREVFGVGLKEAKEAVEALERRENVQVGTVSVQTRTYTADTTPGNTGAGSRGRSGCVLLAAALLLGVVGGIIWFSAAAEDGGLREMQQEVLEAATTAVPNLPTALPIASATPAFAEVTLTFGGEEGIGPGFFNDTRRLGLDGEGNIYTGDYSGGRIQVFDADGSYLTQWNVGEDLYMTSMTVSRSGIVYVARWDQVLRFQGPDGAALDPLLLTMRVETMAAAPDGSVVLLAEDRLVRLNADGEVALDVPEPFANVADFTPFLNDLFVDGAGNIYLVGMETIFKLDSDGRFLTRIGSRGEGEDQFRSSLTSVAVDGQGRIYVDDIFGIKVLDANGRYLDTIDFTGVAFDMEITSQNQLLVMDRNGNQVLQYTLNR